MISEDDRRKRVTAVERELAILSEDRGKKKRHGAGEKACVVIVDMQCFFIDDDDPVCTAALEASRTLATEAHVRRMPVFFVKVVYDHVDEMNIAQRTRHLEACRPLFRGGPLAEIHPLLKPTGGDFVIEKKHASAFAGSGLQQRIDELGCDTVFLTGTTTSGCIRATAIEGAALGLRMILVEEACYEPRPLSGPIALSELADRYADVVSLDEARRAIAQQ